MDQTCYLSCSAALTFYKRLGGRAALVEYAKPLLDWAQQMLCHALGTPVLPIPPNMQVRANLSTSNSRVECAMYNTKCTNFTCFVSRKFLFDIMITNPYLHSASLIILTKL